MQETTSITAIIQLLEIIQQEWYFKNVITIEERIMWKHFQMKEWKPLIILQPPANRESLRFIFLKKNKKTKKTAFPQKK